MSDNKIYKIVDNNDNIINEDKTHIHKDNVKSSLESSIKHDLITENNYNITEKSYHNKQENNHHTKQNYQNSEKIKTEIDYDISGKRKPE